MGSNNPLFIGVDVGSGSVRAALITSKGKVLRTSVKNLQLWNTTQNYYEQSSDNIWECCLMTIKDVIEDQNKLDIKGIGFDATCSLVVLDANGEPLPVGKHGDSNRNIIMWMDHRAQAEADLINQTNHYILQYVGGKVSLEMELPKILWLKKNLPSTWNKIGHIFDLPDFLTWKATGSRTRSLCSLVCKWNYEISFEGTQGWNEDFLKKIGLGELTQNEFAKIGSTVLSPGDACGDGLTREISEALNLLPGTPVGTSIIDAHAGGLGMIGSNAEGIPREMTSRLGLICGTSTCLMAVSEKPIMVRGVWGPYFGAMVPNMWLNEAGQSASGLLLDHVISSHPYGIKLLNSGMNQMQIRTTLRSTLLKMARTSGLDDVSPLTKNFHIWPDYHGNRSPLADPTLKGMIVGLTIDSSEDDLAILYLATLQSLAFGVRHIIDAMVKSGHDGFKSMLICGGLSNDPLYLQIQADIVGIPILRPHEKESVLLGAAILGACASKHFISIKDAVGHMGSEADVITPNVEMKNYHDKKYNVFLKMLSDQTEYKRMMS